MGPALRSSLANSDHDEEPAFSPDGTMLVYSGGPDGQRGDIKVMTVAGEPVTQLTDFVGRDESPDWQTIPAPRTTRKCETPPEFAIRDLRTRGVSCSKALKIVRRWLEGRFANGGCYEAQVDDFGGTDRVMLTRRRQEGHRLVTFLSEATTPP